MGARIRAHDWSETPLGPAEAWPQSLRSALSICLNASFPIALYWGSDLRLLYNDDWSAIPGEKHPWVLGRPAREAWPEIWDIISPLFESVMVNGEATRSTDQLLPMHRHGFTEECYFDYTFSPIRGESGAVDGVFNAVIETTLRVIGERRLRTLRELADWKSGASRSVPDACLAASKTLAANPHDLPFALLYLLDADGLRVTLAGLAGVDRDSLAAPATVDLKDQAGCPWPFLQVVESALPVEVHDLVDRVGALSCGVWPEPPTGAVVLPLVKPGQTQLAGFVVAGVSPRLVMNDEYRGFLDLLAGHIASAVLNAKAYEEERQRAEALAELDTAKTAFFSNVSHEFRTPLTLMLGPVEDLLTRNHAELTPAATSQLEVVNRNGRRLLRLVNTLLDFSRIEAGRVRASYRPTDLAAFTADLASNFRSACERAKLRLNVDCSPLGEPVFVDPEMWEKIVLNLLSNAFKFTFEGEIDVTLRRVGNAAELRVRDTGTGIPAAEMPRLFERFHRVQGAKGRTHEGSGIGLALVQELAKLHGGAIAAESTVGEGTTITITVPLGSDHLPSDRVGDGRGVDATRAAVSPFIEEALRWLPSEAEDTPNSERSIPLDPLSTIPREAVGQRPEEDRPLVLVADDNADMRQYIARLLSERFRIETVTDGQAALAAARERLPDLVLSDIMMPRLDGFGLLRELRADPRTRTIPVLMLSARAGEESRVEGVQAGADDYLVKPFGARELLARVNSHLQMARLRRESEQAVRASEARFRALVTASSDMVYRMAADWSEIRHLHGLEFVADIQAPDRMWLDTFIHPDDRHHVSESIQQAISTKGVFELEHRLPRADGTLGWAFSRAVPLLDASGDIVEWFGATSDVTARKQAEMKLHEERDLLRVTLGSIGDAVITTDTEGRITNMNAVAEALTDWTGNDARGRALEDVFHIVNESTRAPVKNPATKALQEGVVVGLANHTILIAKDGKERPIDDSAAPIRDAEGAVIGCVLVFRDVTERRREESLLTSQNRVLERVVRGGPLNEILDSVCLAIEQHVAGDVFATVFLTDESDKLLRPAAGGRCPEEYLKAISPVAVGPASGSCGTAAFRGELVVVSDIATDPLWDDDRSIALQYGLRSCWSAPIVSSKGAVLGTFALYGFTPGRPDDPYRRVLEFLTRTAGIAIERQRAEQALRESEHRYRLVGEAANDAIWDWDLVTNQVTWNEGVRTCFGYAPAQVDADASWWVANIHPDDRDAATHDIHSVTDSDRDLWQHEYRFRRADGSYAAVFDRGRVVRADGVPVRMVGSIMDLTERKRAEAALRESEERFRAIFTQTLAGIAETDLTGRFLQANQRYCEIVGRTVEELRDMQMHDITHPEDLAHNLPLFDAAVTEGTPFFIEQRYVRPDGSVVWVSNSVALIRDDQDRPKRMVAASVDITANKRAVAALRESEAHFRSMADNAPTMIWVTDSSAQCTYISKQWCEYTGTDQHQNLGLGWFDCVHPDDQRHTQDTFLRANEKHAPFSVDYRLKRHDGEYRWAVDTGLPRFDEQGEFQGYVGTVTDIHERRHATEALRKAAAELSEADRRKNEFLATLAHELRNPLAPIRNGVELIGLSAGNWDTVERARNLIDRQLNQMVHLVDDLMDMSRISTGKLQLRMGRVSLSSVVGSAVETSHPLVDQMGHQLTVTLPKDSIFLEADPTRLAQVFLNLLNNAAKYSKPSGRIWLTAEHLDDEVVVSVKDQGIGIVAEQLPHVFEMFSQVDPSLERSQGGLGIGLSLVKRLVELHGGSIEAQSEGLGEGSEFIVRLPVPAETTAPEHKPARDEDYNSALRILVVDDNQDGANSLAMMLEILGNEVCTAYDGEEAVDAAEKFRPNVILLDIGLPKLNGHEACRRIRKLETGKQMIIFAQTGWGQEEDRRRTHEAGFDHHLVKPVDPKALMTLLRSLPQKRTAG